MDARKIILGAHRDIMNGWVLFLVFAGLTVGVGYQLMQIETTMAIAARV